MYCNKCGTEIPGNSSFCLACGAPVKGDSEQLNDVSVPAVRKQEPSRPLVINPLYGDCLKWGIMALAFACSCVPFLGIFFGYKAKNTCADALKNNNGQPLSGKAKVGSVLGEVGRIVGIVMTVLLAIYLLIVIFWIIWGAIYAGKALDAIFQSM